MDNVDHILELLQLRWQTFALMMLLCIASGLMLGFYRQKTARLGTLVAMLVLVAFVWPGIVRDYRIILLDGEEDKVAERAFRHLETQLTDRQLEKLLLDGGKHNRYLGKANVRFYLAILAIKRGLRIDPGNIQAPRFFDENSFNTIARGHHFPTTYEGLSQRYRETGAPE